MQPEAAWARDLARTLLEEPLPRRWAHTQGVAARAESFAPVVGFDTKTLAAAAWLHDIGYSPAILTTGFHPLDGARYLRDTKHAPARLCRLVAHHSCARVEAEERGLSDLLLGEFPADDDPLTTALIYCDMTTSPDGKLVTYDERLTEILNRYGEDDIVSRSMKRASPAIRDAISAAENLLSTM
jgi:predicted hydrolase (HD superfamily)